MIGVMKQIYKIVGKKLNIADLSNACAKKS